MLLAPSRYPDVPARRAFLYDVAERVRTLPGVQSVALVNPLPFGPVDITLDGGFRIAGRPDPGPGQVPQALFTRITPGYFGAMKIPLWQGRDFTERDTDQGPGVAIPYGGHRPRGESEPGLPDPGVGHWMSGGPVGAVPAPARRVIGSSVTWS